MARGHELATDLETANRRLVELVSGLTDSQWRATAANSPGYRFDSTEKESRSIAQVALHTANQHIVQMNLVRRVAEGTVPPAPTETSPQANSREATENSHPSRADVLRLLEDNAVLAAAMLRGLTDAQLSRATTFKGWTMTAEQLAEQSLIGHVH